MINIGKFSFGLKKSPLGFIFLGLYVAAGLLALGWGLYSSTTNTGDSGLSFMYLYFITLPWMNFIPNSLAYSSAWNYLFIPVSILMFSLNGLILYFIFGGLKISKKQLS